MLINVMFRDVYKKEFNNGPFAFNCEFDVNVGDLVIVQTRYGLSLAQVYQKDVRLTAGVRLQIQDVLEVCKIHV